MANPWLHEAQKASDDLPILNDRLSKYKIEEQDFYEKILESKASQQLEELAVLEKSINSKQLELDKAITELKSYDSKIELYDTWMQNANAKLIEAKQLEKDVKFNKNKQQEINEVISERNELSDEIKKIETNILSMSGRIEVAKQTKLSAVESINRLRELELQYKGFEYYLLSIKRDGVPYQLITKAIPQIEAEINNILTQVVDFTMILDTDGKNINGYIVYDSDNYWPLELTSGMEKFVASLAIRTSLINVTSLPRPNFLAIDEGFGVLDSDNFNSLFMLFQYLKSQFQFIVVISHLDSMRDIVNDFIEIQKVNGYSKINHF